MITFYLARARRYGVIRHSRQVQVGRSSEAHVRYSESLAGCDCHRHGHGWPG